MIQIVTCDVDGSITDSGIYYFSNGVQARKFSTYDGEGFGLLKKAGIEVILLSQSDAQEIKNRAAWLDVPFFGGVYNKAYFVRGHSKQVGIPLEDFAHFGNDINDLEIMSLCGFSGCPSDAHPEIIQYCKPHEPIDLGNGIAVGKVPSGYVCKHKGGEGALREFVDVILNESPR